MVNPRTCESARDAQVLTAGSSPADAIAAAYARFQSSQDDDKAKAWDAFADLCETHLPTILEALRRGPVQP